MSPVDVDQVRRTLRAALGDDDARGRDLTLELLDMMISAAVNRELDRRRDMLWKRMQRIGIIVGIIAGASVILNILFGG